MSLKRIVESFDTNYIPLEEQTLDEVSETQHNLTKALFDKVHSLQKRNVTNIKTYEHELQKVIEKFFPDKSWWEVTVCNIFWSLFEKKDPEQTVIDIIKGLHREFKEDVDDAMMDVDNPNTIAEASEAGDEISEYQKWVDYDMKKYGKISKDTLDRVHDAGFSIVKDQYGDYEVIADRDMSEDLYDDNVDFDEALDDKLVIYKELGKYRATPKSNYGKRVADDRKVQRLDDFDSAEEIKDYYKKWFGSTDDDFEVIDEGYELLSGTKVKAFRDYAQAKKFAESHGLKEAEYGDAYGISYCYWNKSGDRNEDEEVVAWYKFRNGKPVALSDDEAETYEDRLEITFDDLDESLKEADTKTIKRYSDVRKPHAYWYFTTHGIGPGAQPNDLHVLATIDGQNEKGTEGTFVALDGILNTSELKQFDMKEMQPKNIPQHIKDKIEKQLGKSLKEDDEKDSKPQYTTDQAKMLDELAYLLSTEYGAIEWYDEAISKIKECGLSPEDEQALIQGVEEIRHDEEHHAFHLEKLAELVKNKISVAQVNKIHENKNLKEDFNRNQFTTLTADEKEMVEQAAEEAGVDAKAFEKYVIKQLSEIADERDSIKKNFKSCKEMSYDDWKALRDEIVLGSYYTRDYENSFGLDPSVVAEIADGYIEHLTEYAEDTGEDVNEIDTPEEFAEYSYSVDWSDDDSGRDMRQIDDYDYEANKYRKDLFDSEYVFNLVGNYQRQLARHLIGEKLNNKAQHKKLTEGTSNFWSMDNFPLLVFGYYEDVYDRVYDMTKDQLGDEFDGEVDETKEFEDNWDMYFDYCVLDEDEVDRLQDKIKDFVYEINADDRHNSYEEADVDIEIKPGYYEAAQIFVDDEKYLSDWQIEEINKFLEELKSEFGLSQFGVSYQFSNGETGYTKVNEGALTEDEMKYLYTFTDETSIPAYDEEDAMAKYDRLWKGREGATRSWEEIDKIAQELYDKRDEEGFADFNDEELAQLWAHCQTLDCAYDDEVYDMIKRLPHEDKIFAKAEEIFQSELKESLTEDIIKFKHNDGIGYTTEKNLQDMLDNHSTYFWCTDDTRDIVDNKLKYGYSLPIYTVTKFVGDSELLNNVKAYQAKLDKSVTEKFAYPYIRPTELAVEQFLDRIGFDDKNYQHTTYADNRGNIIVSFTDGISDKDFGIIKKAFKEKNDFYKGEINVYDMAGYYDPTQPKDMSDGLIGKIQIEFVKPTDESLTEGMLFKPMTKAEAKDFYNKIKSSDMDMKMKKIVLDDLNFFTDNFEKDYGKKKEDVKESLITEMALSDEEQKSVSSWADKANVDEYSLETFIKKYKDVSDEEPISDDTIGRMARVLSFTDYDKEELDEKKKCESIQKPQHIVNESDFDDIRIYMNTWANYNENGADLSRYGIESIADGWLTVEEALEFAEEHAEDEPFINDTDNVPFEISEYDNAVSTLEALQRLQESNVDEDVVIAIIEATGNSIDEAIDIAESGDYYFYPNVDNDTDLAHAVIDSIGSLGDALGDRVTNYIDEDAMRSDYEYDVRNILYDDAKSEIAREEDIDEDEVTDEQIEEWVDNNFDSYMDSIMDDEISAAERGEIDLSNYFDYEAFGRDLRFDGYTYTDKGAILIL